MRKGCLEDCRRRVFSRQVVSQHPPARRECLVVARRGTYLAVGYSWGRSVQFSSATNVHFSSAVDTVFDKVDAESKAVLL